jgi:hypothetical protein
MAKNRSYLKFEGTLDGLTFYDQKGQSLVKTKTSVNKSRIMNDPKFKTTRQNMTEFGGCAQAGKAFRKAFGGMIGVMGDSYISARVSALMKQVNLNTPGLRGRRNIDLAANSDLLIDFPFNPVDSLDAVLRAPYNIPTLNGDRDVATWIVPDFNTDSFLKSPEGATHFQLILALGIVSNYEYIASTGKYKPVEKDYNGIGTVAYSPYIPIGGMVGADTTITADLTIGAPIPATVVSIAAIGISFFQEVDGVQNQLSSSNCLEVSVVQ